MDTTCSCNTHATHNPTLQKNLTTRLNRVEGQIRGINRMIEQSAYCDDVLTQISAVQASLNSITKILLSAHIDNCLSGRLAQGDTTASTELMETVGRLLQRGVVFDTTPVSQALISQ